MTDEAGAQTIRLNLLKGAGQEMAERFWAWVEKPGKTRLEAIQGVSIFFSDPARADAYTQDLLATGLPLDQQLDEDEERVLHALAVGQFVEKVGSFDALSQICIGTASNEKRYEPWTLYNPAAFLGGFAQPGHFGLIHGPALGVGKTSFAVLLMPHALQSPDVHVLTNIWVSPPEDMEERVHQVSKLSDILRIGLELESQGKRWLCILDEALFFFSRQEPMSKDVRDFDRFIRWVRKLNGCIILITHFEERDIPEKAKPFLTTRFKKPSKGVVHVDIRTDQYVIVRRITGVPNATWPFETKGKAGLDMDIDIAHLHKWLNSRAPPDLDSERRLMFLYLDDPKAREENLEEGEDPEDEDPDEARIEEIRANPLAFRKPNGKVDVQEVMEYFGVKQGKAYELAGRALKRGWGIT